MNQQSFRPGGWNILPPVIKNLLILNGIFFLATITFQNAFNIDLNDILGLHYFSAEKFAPYQFITYMFMHGGFTHILFNMFALWMFGRVLENVWGPKRFITYYLITGIGAAIVHYVVFYFEIAPVLNAIQAFEANPSIESFKAFIGSENFQVISYDIQNQFNDFRIGFNQTVGVNDQKALQMALDFMSQYRTSFLNAPVVVGASGAVFGILLAFGMLFPNSVLYIYFAFPIKAKYFVMIYGAIELYSGFADTGGNVAHFAHLGGMLFGYIVLRYWKSKKILF